MTSRQGSSQADGERSPSAALAGLSPAHRPFVTATAALQGRLDLTPLGLPVGAGERFDPTRVASAPLLDRLERLDALTYGALGMTSPRWALYDCAELPGAIAGFGARACDLTPALRATLEAEGDDAELVPVSMVVATPMLGDGRWLIYAMCAADGSLPAALAMTLALLRARRVVVTTRWRSRELALLADLAPLEVLAAWLPAHDHPATCVLELDLDERRPAPPNDAADLDLGDERAVQRLQDEIEAGARAWVVGLRGDASVASVASIALLAPGALSAHQATR